MSGVSAGAVRASGDRLLATKLFPPPLRPDTVGRPRLWQRIERGTALRLTVVAAPAGSGKTTAVAEWLANTRLPVAWLSLDESDDDPVLFWRYVVAALQRLDPALGVALSRSLAGQTPLGAEAIATLLANDVVRHGNRLALALEDMHTVRSPAVHAALTYLIDHMPPQLHLLVTTRADPPWPLFRWRALGHLAELRANDLRFTGDEAAALLEASGLHLPAGDIAALTERTEGWATGLQLAALTLRGRPDPAAAIHAFAGDDRYVIDYLLGEVLLLQPSHVQDFLLRTSVLDRLCGALCDAVTGDADGQERLEQLERANLFLVPLDGERQWYRYHHLFADLLRSRLRSLPAAELSLLHRRASAWLAERGHVPEAISHALAGDDLDNAARLVEAIGHASLLRGEIRTVLGWLSTMPPEVVAGRPHLAIDKAWALVLGGAAAEAEPALAVAEAAVDALPAHERETAVGEIEALRGHAARQRGDLSAASESSRRALARLPAEAHAIRGLAALNLGLAQWMDGNLDGAEPALVDAASAGEQAGDLGVAVVALSILGQVFELRGHLRRAMHSYDRALALSGDDSGGSVPFAGLAQVGRAGVLWEWGRADEAREAALQGLALGRAGGHVETQAGAYSTLAAIAGARGETAAAIALLDEARRRLAGRVPPVAVASMDVARAGLLLTQGDAREAERVCARYVSTAAGPPSALEKAALMLRARLALVRVRAGSHPGDAAAALSFVDRVLAGAEAGGQTGVVIEALVLRALLLQAQGDLPEASLVIARALDLAGTEGFVRVFADEGAPMASLLMATLSCDADALTGRRVRVLGAHSPARGMHVRAMGTHTRAMGTHTRAMGTHTRALGTHTRAHGARVLEAMGHGETASQSGAGHHPVEPLTPREVEVLRLLATGASNQEMADRFVVSLHTVKKHLSNVFGKLAVTSRTQAVARARELGLL